MSQIAKSIKFMLFDFLSMTLTTNDSILIFYLRIARSFICNIS
jgi:hypothetical protein